jgi:uridine kinase
LNKQSVLEGVADIIRKQKEEHPFLVAIDGIDCAGKTTFADDLEQFMTDQGFKIIRASLDEFHNPKEFRHQRGKDSPEGYYLDSFNYKVLFDYLLDPLRQSGSREYRTKAFDYKKDEWIKSELKTAEKDNILIFDGVFLLRPQINEVWDLRIYLDISYDECLRRARERDGKSAEIVEKYKIRYISGQKLYHMHAGPKRKADIIINNKDPENPIFTYVNPRLLKD